MLAKKYDLGITLPANEFTLLNLLKDDLGNLTVKAGEQTSTSKTFIGGEDMYVEDDSYRSVGTEQFDVDSGSLVDKALLVGHSNSISSMEWYSKVLPLLATKNVLEEWYEEVKDVYDDYWFPFSVGGNYFVTPETAFRGNLSEVRVWDHVLSAKEEANYNDRTLSGFEKGLQIYGPLNEPIGHLAFDASCTNDYFKFIIHSS
jgi:hypothetical protein